MIGTGRYSFSVSTRDLARAAPSNVFDEVRDPQFWFGFKWKRAGAVSPRLPNLPDSPSREARQMTATMPKSTAGRQRAGGNGGCEHFERQRISAATPLAVVGQSPND
jgi:hypothetical protein